ncbi:hypothetical protein HUN42_00074 [Streptomyces phage Dagobah]|nr:hypothetical protein HUN42_00074 [Streptomyces phage Dagobah]
MIKDTFMRTKVKWDLALFPVAVAATALVTRLDGIGGEAGGVAAAAEGSAFGLAVLVVSGNRGLRAVERELKGGDRS